MTNHLDRTFVVKKYFDYVSVCSCRVYDRVLRESAKKRFLVRERLQPVKKSRSFVVE